MHSGIQLYTVREAAEADLLGTIRQVAEMGYDAVQFAGFFNTPAKDVHKVLQDHTLQIAGSHTGLDALVGEKFSETIAYSQQIGNDLLICPALPEESYQSVDGLKEAANMLNEIGYKCKENYMTFGYHNHDFEFKHFNEGTGFDIIFENTDPTLVKMELDCYWVTYAAYNPEELIRKYAHRLISLHLKDMKKAYNLWRSTEIGDGVLDIGNLIRLGKEAKVPWFVVEQEDYDGDPMESAAINIRRLKELLK